MEKFVVTVKIERVESEGIPAASCRCGPGRCTHQAGQVRDRKVDTVASVVVTATSLSGAARKAKAHIDAELVELDSDKTDPAA